MLRSPVYAVVAALAGLALLAVPASAASAGTPVTLTYNATVFQAPGSAVTAADNACAGANNMGGMGFDGGDSANATGIPFGTSLQPAGSPIAFQVPPAPPAADALCVGDGQSTTITVPSGNYAAAFFIAAAANGPAVGTVTPTYGGAAGTPIPVAFDDWCALTPAVKGTLTPGNAAVLAGGPLTGGGRLIAKTGAVADTPPLPCGFYAMTVPLDPTQTLSALKVSIVAASAALPTMTGIPAGSTESANAIANIAALTLEGGSAAAAAAALPKTGASPLLPLAGALVLLCGLALLVAPRRARGRA